MTGDNTLYAYLFKNPVSYRHIMFGECSAFQELTDTVNWKVSGHISRQITCYWEEYSQGWDHLKGLTDEG